jgi:nitrate/nitrite-specific signal transduction histidine kinase
VAYLSVSDNGCGLPPADAIRPGARGLMNIRVRAEKIGATVRFYDAGPGTGIEFAFVNRYLAAPHESESDWLPFSVTLRQ